MVQGSFYQGEVPLFLLFCYRIHPDAAFCAEMVPCGPVLTWLGKMEKFPQFLFQAVYIIPCFSTISSREGSLFCFGVVVEHRKFQCCFCLEWCIVCPDAALCAEKVH